MKARRKARKGARKATRRAAAPKARKAKAFKLPVHAACVKRVIRANKAKGVRVTLGEASKLCKEMRQAGVKAATAVKAIPAVGPQEQYAKRCRAKFNSLLGNQLERLEEKYCREGWSRAQIEGVLKTTASSLASA